MLDALFTGLFNLDLYVEALLANIFDIDMQII